MASTTTACQSPTPRVNEVAESGSRSSLLARETNRAPRDAQLPLLFGPRSLQLFPGPDAGFDPKNRPASSNAKAVYGKKRAQCRACMLSGFNLDDPYLNPYPTPR
ncbi:hypothetical protein E4U55_008203 [Claviceps digitariae]|nr:hypothetical protein E4U55_008203 [Claviceps digitariae]